MSDIRSTNSSNNCPRVLVHLHCYYQDQVKGLLRKLHKLIPYANLQMVATVSKSVKDRKRVKQAILSYFGDARIIEVDNLGYDVGPFVEAVNSVDLSNYDYVLKIHTKGRGKQFSAHLRDDVMFNDDIWVDMLLGALIDSPKSFIAACDAFKDDSVGMVGAETCLMQDRPSRRVHYILRVNDELKKMGLPAVQNVCFIAGTMFMARASVFGPLKQYSINDFGKPFAGINDYTLAHTFERLLGGLVISGGYEIRGLKTIDYKKRLVADGLLHDRRLITGEEIVKKKRRVTPVDLARRAARVSVKRKKVIAHSSLFDARWYLKNNPDIGDVDPVVHYLEKGYLEGRNPSKYFDNEKYIETHPECKKLGMNPLLHYEVYLRPKKRGFGAVGYQRLAMKATIENSDLFDAEWYIQNNPDVKEQGIDPAWHYLVTGGMANRDPSPGFCSDEYLSLHPDVRREKVNPLYHFLTNGFIQGHELSSLEFRQPVFSEEACKARRVFATNPAVHRRTAIVATYSSDGTVSDSLLYLLKGVKEVADNIVLIGDCPIIPDELDKLDGLVCYAEYERRGRYDFGSYKQGLIVARELGLLDAKNVDELIMMNDSCYGPVYPFKESFEFMKSHIIYDFWGYNCNKSAGTWYLCSFFYVFNRKIIDSRLLDEFFCRVRGPVTRGVAVEQFEIELSRVLTSQKMKGRSLIGWNPHAKYNHRNILIGLTRYRIPLIKKKSISGEAMDNISTALQIIKRDNPELYSLIDTKQRIYEHHLATMEEFRASIPSIVDDLRNKMTRGEMVKALFLVNDAAMFPGKPLFECMLHDRMYDPEIYVIPDTRDENYIDIIDDTIERHVQSLRLSLPVDRVHGVHRDEYGRWPDITVGADIVCFPSPYNVSSYNYNIRYALGRRFLPIIFNYGYYRSIYDREIMGMYNYTYCWKVFLECSENAKEYEEYSVLGGSNASLVGYVKMDDLAKYQKTEHDRPRILVALHHSVDGGFNDTLALANFIRYFDYFKALPDVYPNIDFVYRPHPALFSALERQDDWDEQKTKSYIDAMKSKQNVIWSDGGDYFQEFADSDACIQDCGSFLVEYVYTGKPCCYMLKDPSDIEAKFAPLGKACLEQCYVSYSTKDIDDFIKDVVLGGDDPKAEGRAELAKRVMVNYPHAAEAALEDIVGSIMNASESKG